MLKSLRKLNPYLWHYRKYLIFGIIFVVASNYFKVLQPQIIRKGLDLVLYNINFYRLGEGFEVQEYLFEDIGSLLMYFGLLVIILSIISGAFMYFMRQTLIVMSRLIEYDLRKRIYDHYQELDQTFYRSHSTGDMMARITEDVSKVRMYLGPALLYFINLVSLFVMVIYSMFEVNVTLSLYTLLPLPFLSLSIYYVSNLINKRSTLIQRQLGRLNSIAQEIYSGIRVVKSYVQEKAMSRFFTEENEQFKQKSLSLARVNAAFFPLMLLLIGTSTILTIYIGGRQVIAGAITAGNLAEFVIYVNMLTWPVTAIGWIASIVQQAEASMERIDEFMLKEPKIQSGNITLEKVKGEIVFENVSFTYPDTGIQALENVSFTIPPGEKWGIVGRTASGKTTIVDLILRLFDPDEGRILLDGVDLREFDLRWLRSQIGYVPQEVFLFSDTIFNNLNFGHKGLSPEEAREYARFASLHEEIEMVPDQYQAFLGERGISLSGGQKQRLSMARAFAKESKIMILDDSLSAVDTKTESKIIGYLRKIASDRTTVVISHRLSVLQDFQRILVLEDGRIVDTGSHDQLLEKGGIYSEMYHQQQLEKSAL